MIGAVDSSTRQSLPGPAAHNDLLQGYQSHCHSDSTLQFTSLISLRTGAWPGMGCLTAVPGFVCVRECELVRNKKSFYMWSYFNYNVLWERPLFVLVYVLLSLFLFDLNKKKDLSW